MSIVARLLTISIFAAVAASVVIAEIGEATAVICDTCNFIARTRRTCRRLFDGHDDEAVGVAVGGV